MLWICDSRCNVRLNEGIDVSVHVYELFTIFVQYETAFQWIFNHVDLRL